jgi:phage gp46-like protein
MADTIAYELEDPDVQFATASVVSGNLTDSIAYELEDPDVQFGTSQVSGANVTDTPGFELEDPDVQFGTSVPVGGGSNSGVTDSVGYLLDQFIGDGVVKHIPTELTFELFGFYLPRIIVPTRRSYEGDVNLVIGADSFDIGISGNDLDRDTTLQTAIMLSLFTDRRAAGTDLLPTPSDRRGWWPDPNAGSKLWLYERAKIDSDLLGALAQEAVDSLKWLVEDQIAMNVNALATKHDNTTVALRIRITLPRRNMREYKFFYNVENQLLR